jgi:hypothetical protein
MASSSDIKLSVKASDPWFRPSTEEWAIDVEISYDGTISSVSRFTGKTQLDVLRDMREHMMEALDEVILEVEESLPPPNVL